MALFSSYAPPGVYTDITTLNAGTTLFGNVRICVLIGEGQENFVYDNVEFHRGSSSVAVDQVVDQDLTAQVNGSTPTAQQLLDFAGSSANLFMQQNYANGRTFQLGYFPVVDSSGNVTNDVTAITATSSGIPATVVYLNGATGVFQTQDIIPIGNNLQTTYNFKRTDTLITNEDDSFQIPSFATLNVTPDGTNILPLTLSLPGETGNLITLTLTNAALSSPPGPGKSDVLAVTGAGTDNISIELLKSDGITVRTLADLQTLVNAGIPTLDGGFLVAGTIIGVASTTALDMAQASFTGGSGPNSNTMFQVQNFPIVDGTNGGVTTNVPSYVIAQVNGTTVAIASMNGAAGQVTLANPVAFGSVLTFTYYFNKYQNTSDLLPGPGPVAAIDEVGLGPNRSDFIEGIDYVLSVDPNTGLSTLNWGNAAITAASNTTAGFTPFDATVIDTTLWDEVMYLRPVTGVVNGTNATFTLQDSPVDGSGLGHVTDNPLLISVYVGSDPYEALANGAVQVIRLDGDSGNFTLFNPPASGNVYASYYRNTMNDHTFTLTVLNPQITGQGTYKIVDEASLIVPVASFVSGAVTDSNFNNLGIVWPHSGSDLVAGLGAQDETFTLHFQADSSSVITPALQAHVRVPASGVNFISYLATNSGTAANATTISYVDAGSGSGVADSVAITATGDAIVVQLRNSANNSIRTLGQIAALFAGGILTPGGGINAQGKVFTTNAGVIIATLHGAGSTLAAPTGSPAPFAGGAAEVDQTKSVSFTVTSSLGVTGTNGTGWLGQTFYAPNTGVKFTIVDPAEALSYGYASLPSPQYAFAPNDTLTFSVASATPRVTSITPTVAVPGILLEVLSTYGMNSGDQATIQTHNNAGQEPNVGEFYYVSYETNKTAADMALQLFTNPADAYNIYGQPNVTNRLSLAVQLLTQNGAQQFACIQVPKQPGLAVASDQDFISAIGTLTVALPQTANKVNVVVPLSNSATVQQYLSRFLTTQSSVRNKGEAIGFIGPNQYATPNQISALAQSIANERIILVGNPVAGVSINVNGTGIEYAVSGEFIAAALAGLNVNPANDVAQSLVNQNVVGFTRLLQKFDDATMDNMSSVGVTPLLENNGALLVRDYLTTDPTSILTSEPTATTVTDYVRQTFRAGLKQFIGRKFLPTLTGDIMATCNSILRGLVSNQIVQAYNTPIVTQDQTDPTVADVTVEFMPIFTLKYISVEFAVTTAL